MANTPQQPSEVVCTHERRPGTTVCLHCRHAARISAQAQRTRLVFRGSAAAIVFGTLIVAGSRGATAPRLCNWKWLEPERGSGLYDLATDPGETKDLSAEKPDMLANVKARWEAWRKEMDAPANRAARSAIIRACHELRW